MNFSPAALETGAENVLQPQKFLNILVIEDDIHIAKDIEQSVWECGYTPFGPARCFQSAMALADSAQIDVALIDLHLEDGESGLAIAKCLAERGVRIVILSDSDDRRPELAELEHTFVAKPVNKDLLSHLMASWARLAPVINTEDKQLQKV